MTCEVTVINITDVSFYELMVSSKLRSNCFGIEIQWNSLIQITQDVLKRDID